MNKWTKTNVVKTIKEQLAFNVKMFVQYLQEAGSERIVAMYQHSIWEDIDILKGLGYLSFEQADNMKRATIEYYKKH